MALLSRSLCGPSSTLACKLSSWSGYRGAARSPVSSLCITTPTCYRKRSAHTFVRSRNSYKDDHSACSTTTGHFSRPSREKRVLNTRAVSIGAAVPSPSVSDASYGHKEVIQVTEPVYEYILANTREPEILAQLRQETSSMIGREMQVSPEQGQFLAMLVKLMGATRCIEVGVYTGYSSVSVALALPEGGTLVACERVAPTLAVARKYYALAGVAHKVDVREGMAQDTLAAMLAAGEANSFDYAFLDADKRSYFDYYELLLQLVRPGGVVVVDNVLWHGRVSDPQVADKKTVYMRQFNEFVMRDPRVCISMIPVGDGMTLCRKR